MTKADSLDCWACVDSGRARGRHCAAAREYRARLPGRRSKEAIVGEKVSPDGRGGRRGLEIAGQSGSTGINNGKKARSKKELGRKKGRYSR